MRKILCLAACFLMLGAATASAENIVVFDLQQVAGDCDALKEARAALDAKFGPQKTELEKERGGLEKKAEEYQKKKPTDKQLEAFAKQQREYGDKAQAFMRLLQADELRVRQDIDTVINRATKNLAARKSYTLILDVALVPYADPKLDVTADMLTETNIAWKQIRKELGGEGETPASPAK
jgi:outer membrane protein